MEKIAESDWDKARELIRASQSMKADEARQAILRAHLILVDRRKSGPSSYDGIERRKNG